MAAPETIVFINGKKVFNEVIDLSVLKNCPVHVFETLRIYNGSIFRMKEHINRLFASAKTIGLDISKNRRRAIENNLFSVLSCLKKKNDVFLRLTVTADDIIIFVFNRSHPDAIYRCGIDLNTTAVRRHPSCSFPPEAKTNQFLNGILGRLDVRESRVDDALFLDQDGNVRELSVWNIFIVKNGEIITPPPVGILDGVTRRFVIECAHVKRFHVEEKELTRHDIWNSDEAFVTNTSGEIVPVRSLDGRKIGNQIPGPVTKILQKQFHKEIRN